MESLNFHMVLRNYFPICFLNNDELLLSKRNKIFVLSLKAKKLNYFLSLRTSLKQNLIGKVYIASRLLRLGIRYGLITDDHKLLIVYDNSIFEIDLDNLENIYSYDIKRGRQPLSISIIKNILGFEDIVCFGEYFNNPCKEAVNIYRKTNLNNWEVIYSFPKGAINHVHSIVPDKFNNCVWILTGDFGNAATIWIATDNFKKVSPVSSGDQLFRSCVAFPTPDGLIYATDSQFQQNSIRLLCKLNDVWISKRVSNVNGPVIYGCIHGGNFVFSTSVEGLSYEKSGVFKFLDREIAPGIREGFSHIIYGNLKDGFKVIYKNEKDYLPFILFQFGVIQFPNGLNNSDFLVMHNTSLKSHDYSTCIINLKF